MRISERSPMIVARLQNRWILLAAEMFGPI
jgi:hypothetical protein